MARHRNPTPLAVVSICKLGPGPWGGCSHREKQAPLSCRSPVSNHTSVKKEHRERHQKHLDVCGNWNCEQHGSAAGFLTEVSRFQRSFKQRCMFDYAHSKELYTQIIIIILIFFFLPNTVSLLGELIHP